MVLSEMFREVLFSIVKCFESGSSIPTLLYDESSQSNFVLVLDFVNADTKFKTSILGGCHVDHFSPEGNHVGSQRHGDLKHIS